MVIRTREEAIQALSEILRLEKGRRIMEHTVKLAECVTPEAREVLLRAQEGIVTGTLRGSLQARPAKAADPKAQPEEDRLAKEIATALQAMSVAERAFEAFPALRAKFARWEVARAAIQASDDVRRLIEEGATRGKGADALADLVTRMRPWWHTQIPSIAMACEEVRREQPDTPWRIGARSLLDIVATTELRPMYGRDDTAGTVAAMMQPLRAVLASLQKLVRQVHPRGLPPDSSLAP